MGQLVRRHRCGVDPGGQVPCLFVAHRQAEPPPRICDRDSERGMGKQRVAEIKQHAADFHATRVRRCPELACPNHVPSSRLTLCGGLAALAVVLRVPTFVTRLFDPDEAAISVQAMVMRAGGTLVQGHL